MRVKLRAGVLISGRGSNMEALLRATQAPDYPAEIAVVVSNRYDAAGLEIAAEAGLPTAVIDHRGYDERESFDREVSEALDLHGADIVCLAGFMRIVSPWFVEEWTDETGTSQLLNIHPSLLPDFRGLHPQRQALEAGVSVSGCTVHRVTADLDAGPIVGRARVPVLPGDTEETLAARILEWEHRLYPACLKAVAEDAPLPIEMGP